MVGIRGSVRGRGRGMAGAGLGIGAIPVTMIMAAMVLLTPLDLPPRHASMSL